MQVFTTEPLSAARVGELFGPLAKVLTSRSWKAYPGKSGALEEQQLKSPCDGASRANKLPLLLAVPFIATMQHTAIKVGHSPVSLQIKRL